MLYQLYETQRSLMEPFVDFAKASSKVLGNPKSPFSQNPIMQRMSAEPWEVEKRPLSKTDRKSVV